jgi:hypothetical protein
VKLPVQRSPSTTTCCNSFGIAPLRTAGPSAKYSWRCSGSASRAVGHQPAGLSSPCRKPRPTLNGSAAIPGHGPCPRGGSHCGEAARTPLSISVTLIDANLLLDAINRDALQHECARQWLVETAPCAADRHQWAGVSKAAFPRSSPRAGGGVAGPALQRSGESGAGGHWPLRRPAAARYPGCKRRLRLAAVQPCICESMRAKDPSMDGP